MKFQGVSLILAFLVIATSTCNGTTKIGIGGIQSFTNHQRIASPTGLAIFAQKSLGRSVALRFDLSRFEDKQEYEAVTYRSVPPRGDIDKVRDRFRAYSTMYCGEISLQFRVLESSRLQLHFGLGPGVVVLNGVVNSTRTAYQSGGDPAEKFCFAFWLDLSTTEDQFYPFTFDLTLRQRFAHEELFASYDSNSSFSKSLRATELLLSVAAIIVQ